MAERPARGCAACSVASAISLGFGVVFATLISLVLVPTLYLVLEDLRRAGAASWQGLRRLYH